jgi:serine/threonine protein phosphatase PrpC
VSAPPATNCEACHAALLPGDRFCEVCGARVAGAEGDGEPGLEGACHACGAPPSAIGLDGYCTRCGALQRAPGDRSEVDLAFAAAVSDQGRVHRRNEDAFHLERGERAGDAVAVICDGISTSRSGHLAARAAAAVAGGMLARALGDGTADAEQLTVEAVRAADEAVVRVPTPATTRAALAPPSCTLVCATCRDREVVIGSIGDSRAYWLAPEGARVLTVDDSWATEQSAAGLLDPEQAAADPRAHAITRWLGPDVEDVTPQIRAFSPDGPGRLLLCSDGLWNYAPAPADLLELLAQLPAKASALVVARALVDAALVRGGRDNITVVVIDIAPEGRSPQ